tara:strand:+ start:357 stop:620 length:264 start_codon:yes stop_codon:yes gene_type:complete
METTHKTLHKFPQSAHVQLWYGSIEVSDARGSGDSLNVSVPSDALKDAVKLFLIQTLTRSQQEGIVSMLTDLMRKEDAERLAAETSN